MVFRMLREADGGEQVEGEVVQLRRREFQRVGAERLAEGPLVEDELDVEGGGQCLLDLLDLGLAEAGGCEAAVVDAGRLEQGGVADGVADDLLEDRKSTRLNSSH